MSKPKREQPSKPKHKKQVKWQSRLKTIPWFAWVAIGLVAVAMLSFVSISVAGKSSNSHKPVELRAAIIDQLYSMYPNEGLMTEFAKQLEDHGFGVDFYQGDAVTVDLYRELPGYGYRLIILRTHSGILSHETDSGREVTRATALFTNEEYTETKHVKEQLNGELAQARVGPGYPIVFGIGARFVKYSMRSDFKGSVIIMMGCSGLSLRDLASAYSDRGASLYLAWDGLVGLHYLDEAGLQLLKNLFAEDTTVGDSVENTMESIGPDPDSGARLGYYPPQSGSKTFMQLIE
ncbi:hypothetical protein ACFLVS_05345 [Chloroflexota bacterium]